MTKPFEKSGKTWQEIKQELDDIGLLERSVHCSNDFWTFAVYYFSDTFFYPYADRHIQYGDSLQSDQNVLVIGHRESVKTRLANIYVVRCVIFKKYMYMLWGGYSIDDAQKNIYDIRTMFEENDLIQRDYGNFVFEEKKEKNKSEKKRSIKSIHFANGVFLNTTSIRKSTRGFKHTVGSKVYRPQLLMLDDIDVNDSVTSTKIIDKNYRSLEGQTFGGLPGDAKIVCLGNVILQDGLVPRLRDDKFGLDTRDCYRIPSYVNDHGDFVVNNETINAVGKFTRDRFVDTKEEAQRLNQTYQKETNSRVSPYVSHEYLREKDGSIGYNQNHLLIPYVDGTVIIKKSMIRYGWLNIDHTVFVTIGVDPAFSENTNSDALAVSIVYHKMINGNHYKFVYDVYELKGEDKEQEKAEQFIENLYIEHNASLVRVEGNNGGENFGKNLRKRGLAVDILFATKDKVTRLREVEPEFSQELVYFRKGISQEFVDQLTTFPNSKNDDMVDAMGYGLGNPNYAVRNIKDMKNALQKSNGKKRKKYVDSEIAGRF